MNAIIDKIAAIQAKKNASPISEMTAYDYPSARMVDEAGCDIILVGDSLGMVVMGFPDTTHVKLEHMLHHVSMVARGSKNALIVGDMPIHSYDSVEQALETAQALRAAGAHIVKLEGGKSKEEHVRRIVDAGIPVQGHIGLLPQSVKEQGGYRIHGKNDKEAASIMHDMQALVRAGVCSIVIECTRQELTREITRACPVPTIGIGCGKHNCDGEVIVYHDLIGAYPWFVPGFVKAKASISIDIMKALHEWKNELQIPLD